MARFEIGEEREVFVVVNTNEWPLHVYEGEGHALDTYRRKNQSPNGPGRAKIYKARLVIDQELELIQREEYLKPKEPRSGV